MHLIATILAETEAPAPLILPGPVFALIAFAVFVALGYVTWSFRDVANRHRDKVTANSSHGDSHGGSHGAGH